MLGRRLRLLRQQRGETLTETAARAGLSPQYLSEVERGVKEPSSEMIAAVAGALEATLLDLTVAVARDLGAAERMPAERASRRTEAPAAERATVIELRGVSRAPAIAPRGPGAFLLAA